MACCPSVKRARLTCCLAASTCSTATTGARSSSRTARPGVANGDRRSSRQRLAAMIERARKRLSKRAKKGFRGWPVATVALYGPDDSTATKLTVAIMPAEAAEATDLRRRFSKDETGGGGGGPAPIQSWRPLFLPPVAKPRGPAGQNRTLGALAAMSPKGGQTERQERADTAPTVGRGWGGTPAINVKRALRIAAAKSRLEREAGIAALPCRRRGLPSSMRGGWVYIMTNRPNGTLYVGVTADLGRRAYEHREGLIEGFTRRYGLNVWCGRSSTRISAPPFSARATSSIGRARGRWNFIPMENREWRDLFDELNW